MSCFLQREASSETQQDLLIKGSDDLINKIRPGFVNMWPWTMKVWVNCSINDEPAAPEPLKVHFNTCS